MSDITIPFGKFKNQSIETVYRVDPSYCRWISTQTELMEKNPDIKKFIQDRFSETDSSYMMNWGRYKGRTIRQIKAVDAKYIEWLQENDFVRDKCKKLVDELKNLS